jgi:hypothetical protein
MRSLRSTTSDEVAGSAPSKDWIPPDFCTTKKRSVSPGAWSIHSRLENFSFGAKGSSLIGASVAGRSKARQVLLAGRAS